MSNLPLNSILAGKDYLDRIAKADELMSGLDYFEDCAKVLAPILAPIKRGLDGLGSLESGRAINLDSGTAELLARICANYKKCLPDRCMGFDLIYPKSVDGYEYGHPSELEEEMRRENEELPYCDKSR